MTFVAPGFEAVAEELDRVGGAFAAFVEGEPVVDVWSGEFREDTLVPIFSGTKGLVAVCMLMLLERGSLDLGSPVSRYRPGFAEDVLVRHVVSHTAGLPGLRDGFSVEEVFDPELMEARVAAEAPYWEPGTRLAYHALTYGWICDDLVRRVDGRSVSRFFAEEVAAPLGLQAWIGLPPELEPRVIALVRGGDYRLTFEGDEPSPLVATVYGDLLGGFLWNDPAVHRAEIPGAGAIAAPRSVARLYGQLGDLLSAETIALGQTELSRGPCAITGRPYAFGVGFELQTELERFGPPADAYGHTGSGGSTHGAWPSHGVGFSYAVDELRLEAGDDRSRRVLAALHAAVRD